MKSDRYDTDAPGVGQYRFQSAFGIYSASDTFGHIQAPEQLTMSRATSEAAFKKTSAKFSEQITEKAPKSPRIGAMNNSSSRFFSKKQESRQSVTLKEKKGSVMLDNCFTAYTNPSPIPQSRKKFKRSKKTLKLVRPQTTVKKGNFISSQQSSRTNMMSGSQCKMYINDSSTKGGTDHPVSASNSIAYGGAANSSMGGLVLKKNLTKEAVPLATSTSTSFFPAKSQLNQGSNLFKQTSS